MMLISVDYLLPVTLNEHHEQSDFAMRIYLRLYANGCECARVYVSRQSSPTNKWINRLNYAATEEICVTILS